MSDVRVRPAVPTDADACVAVLARLPDHFMPDTHESLRADVARHPAWVATAPGDDRAVVGVVVAERRFPAAAEITVAAVVPDHQGAGVGTALVDAALAALAGDGVLVVEVTTLDASAGYEPYVATRAFWAARGFRQIDRIDPLPGWQAGNPAAIYVAALGPTRPASGPGPTPAIEEAR
jgi:ribosomal protein S18 acetylase RimI-like enzyme